MSTSTDQPGKRRGAEQSGRFAVSRQRPQVTKIPSPANRTFSTDEITAAIREWSRRYGSPPTMADWEPSRARRLGQEWRVERFKSGKWPSARIVCRQFPTFSAAIEAAGLSARRSPSRLRPNLTGPEAITDALLEWVRRYGDVPTMADWDPPRARRLNQDWRIARYYLDDWPSARAVKLNFGSFAAAITAAGLVPREPGTHHNARGDEQATNRLTATRAGRRSQDPGLSDLSASLRSLANARSTGDPVQIHGALLDIAGAALAWAYLFGSD